MHSFDALHTSTAYAICLAILWLLLTIVLRSFFHPLRSYPGPIFGRITDAYGGYFALGKRLHLTTYENFQKYGPVVRQAPNRLVFNTVEALYDIYLNSRVTKGHSYTKSQLRARYPSIINVIDKDQHRRKRKLIGQPLTERSMRSFEPTMESEIDVFLNLLLESAQPGHVVDMTERCQRLGVDIVGLLAFGFPLNTQTDEKFRFILNLMDSMAWRISTYMQLPALAPLEKVLAWLGVRQVLRFGTAVQTIIQTRMAQEKNAHRDLYSMVADYIGKGQEGLYKDELWPEAILFITAGGTTTATTMSALFFYLSRNPKCYAKLAAEIRSTFESSNDIRSGPQLSSCKYLRACIDETLRMSPPSLTTLWRQQDTKDDSGEPFVVDGHVIPHGTQVGVSLYSIMHNEEYFPDSFTFKPERWLDDSNASEVDGEGEKEDRATMRKAFTPFLIGDRACAGKSMAYMEASLTLARTIWLFDFEVAPGKSGEVGGGKAGRTDGRGHPGEYQLEDIFVAGHRGPNLVFRARGGLHKAL
ncbi:cytochrome P450 [Hypoxylon trugodes]|uniref:cytochrome P450 n=1 Tax=Hypoxylon trugodes TaxID=326681 RepID=UPI00219788E9|nr:cytochrome P450 [Hypoxylon trugodes]KAI1390248.1 cytochrome P450 [Hypoxylon trugodes]